MSAQGAATGADPTVRPQLLRRLTRSLGVLAAAIGLGAAALGAYCGIVVYEGNFHAVSPGVLYRSAQPSDAELQSFVQQYKIRSVLNLRGANTGSPWYDDEVKESRALGLAHYDYGLSARRLVTGRQIADILDIMRRAPKPLLVHCMSGADRAGLVAALYRYAVAGASPEDADRELSLVYGHFPYLTSRTGAMDDSFWAYVRDATRTAAK